MKTPYSRGTTLIAVRTKTHIALGADSLETWGDHPTNSETAKISKLTKDVYIACTGAGAICEILVGLLQERFDEAGCRWLDICRGFKIMLCGWQEVDKDPVHRGLAKTLLADDADIALGIIIAPEGIFKIISTGEFGECTQDVLGAGSGGAYAEGAARALLQTAPKWHARRIARTAVDIAAKSTVFANNIVSVVSVKR